GGAPDAQGRRTALLIDESYNANPASMRATLAQLGRTSAKRRIAVLGAMKELGTHGPGYHAALAQPLAEAGVDFAVLVGAEMEPLARELEIAAKAVSNAVHAGENEAKSLGKPSAFAHCQSVGEAGDRLRAFGLESGDAILVKGSNSVGLASLVSQLARQEG
ncbi:UDP-N-acetylmuramoylalanyl-D-glutamyl-2, 6-diaminopimelate--D-alanyl-D-alanine ligase, partial [Novosphingobium sp. 1949]|nr:UDP-N-acetylmuramoylalanyl-D-glutamyl-2, 6-diaminopimelate--D-alanyl-D-alanine ligase [Novosphingobium organovorum]